MLEGIVTYADLKGRIARFGSNKQGSVAIMFGLAVIPLVLVSGAAIDYGRASATRTQLQTAIDAAALHGTKIQQGLTDPALSTQLRAMTDANFTSNAGANITGFTMVRVDTTDPITGKRIRQINLNASAVIPNRFMSLANFNTTTVDVESKATWGTSDIEIALVLDNTGSMSWSNKMVELKRALCGDPTCANPNPATGFVKLMKDSARYTDQIRVAMVPFDTTVRMPLTIQNQVNAASMSSTTFSTTGAGYCGSNGNSAERTSWFRFALRDKDTMATNRDASNNWVGTGCGVGRAAPATWQGCVWDRDTGTNRDITDNNITTTDTDSLHPAVNCRTNNLARILPLLDIRGQSVTLLNAMATMTPSGNTNLTVGLSWGQAMLTNTAPFQEAKPVGADVKRFLILLTDGDNTENRESGSQATIDARTTQACNSAKAQGITVYAIRVIDGNQSLLQSCASDASKYKEVANAADLTPVFVQIASEISSIRLTN
jgi:Flp pilus assembly protein TadG